MAREVWRRQVCHDTGWSAYSDADDEGSGRLVRRQSVGRGRRKAKVTADSFIKAAHVTRIRHVHQVTACYLHILMKKANLQYTETEPEPGDVKTFEQWCVERRTDSINFYYWSTTLRLELLLLTYIIAQV